MNTVAEIAGRSHQRQHLIFTLGDEQFAIGILAIREIIEFGELTEVPMMPAVVRGVINLRGAVVPVIDLALRFNRKRIAVQARSCVLIVEVSGSRQTVGVLVDGVNEVVEIDPEQIEPPPNFGARLRSDFIAGMAKHQGRFVIILNVDHVLSLEQMTALEGLETQAGARELAALAAEPADAMHAATC